MNSVERLERIHFLYSLYSYLLIKEELFINRLIQLGSLRMIDQRQLNVLSNECYVMSRNGLKNIKEMEKWMSTLHVSASDPPEDLQDLLEEELARLTTVSLEEFAAETAELPATKEDLQQFKRFTYKSFQTLQDLIDNAQMAGPLQEELGRFKEGAMEDQYSMAKTAVEIFNLFDRVRLTYAQENAQVSEKLEAVVTHSLNLLKDLGIHEIEVYGKDFDGDYMESLGTVPAKETEPGLQTYQVAVVFRRAFTFEGNGKVIQDALVKTVL
ncbi:nucleotide exchange factor GrpE [Sporosarcina sp. 179-K 3D1 HS]|uniref:nucleotide exchange factor GrpE n=1 Tax=Sporosarcina sp. 179-K 3D1 HS TaxID=3232169 RepID=UPI0039A20B28